MKHIPKKKLSLSRTTLRNLTGDQLTRAGGAGCGGVHTACCTMDRGCPTLNLCPTMTPPCGSSFDLICL
jgi:hypothetical protein